MGNFFHSKRFLVLLAILWVVSLAAVLLFWLQGNILFSDRFNQQYPVQVQAAQPSGHGPNSYSVPMGMGQFSQNENIQSPARLYEDGRALGPGNASHAVIGAQGGGRFSFWKDGNLYFSSSDNSDPRTNGRKYVLVLPLSLSPVEMVIALVWFGFLTLGLLVTERRILPFVFDVLIHPPFYLCALILILVFLITRLPFFIHYPIVWIAPDSHSYLEIVSLIKLGRLPLFEARPPGYPLFIWLITNIIDRWVVVVVVQSLLFLTASLCLIYGVYSLRRSLSLLATLAMAGFLGSSHILIYETAALSESLYTTFLIFIFAFLLLGFGQCQARYFIMSSVSMGILISIRPAGLYMLVVYTVILIYMFWNKYKPRFIVGFLSPLLLLLFFWSTYNYFTLGRFSLILRGAYNMGSATAWFWEPDQSFPPAVNDVLSELPSDIKAIGVTDADQKTLIGSWDPDQLSPIFNKLYAPLVNKGWTHDRFVGISSDESADSIVRTVMITAIKKHPDLYAKFVWTNLYVFYKIIEVGKWDFYGNITTRVVGFYSDWDGGFHPLDHSFSGLYHNTYLDGQFSKEYSNIYHLDFASVSGSGETAVVDLVDTPLKRLHMSLQPIQWMLFHQIFWVMAFFIVFGVSTLKLLISKGKHLGAFILFVMAITVIGASLITSLSEEVLERYAYPTQFIYYLSVALFPLLWPGDKAGSRDAGKNSKGHKKLIP
jgi:hypothetical protein